MNIVVANRQRTKKINSRRLKEITEALLGELHITNAELGINLVGAKAMTLINTTFLQHEGPTDVITFDHTEVSKAGSPLPAKGAHGATRPTIHGELFVCVDVAITQAKEFKSSWQLEVVRYVIHGVLHLLGHDDLQPDLRRKMKREENRLGRRLAGRFSLAQRSGAAKLGA